MYMNIENNIKIFSLIAGIEKPWILEKVQVDENKDLHMYVKFQRGSKFKCKYCNNDCSVYDIVEKTWRHLNCFEHKTFIHCKVPRIQCKKHGVHLVEVPWAKQGSAFTILFEEFVMQLAKKMSIHAIAKLLDENDGRLWRIVHRYADEYVENLDFKNVTKIGLDETSRKGHDYITVFIDLDTSRVVYIADGKKASTIDEFKKFFEEHNGDPDKVTDVTCDMSMGFTSGIKKAFKNCKITYDKFFDIITNNAESLCGNLYLDVDGLSVEMCDLLKNYISCGFNIIFFRYNVPEILSDNFDSNITIFKIKLDIYNIKLTNTTKISDHIMIYGLPGSGKTTLCKNIAVQMCNKGADVNYFSIKPEYDIFSDVSKDINIHIIDDIIKLTDVISEYYNEMNNRYKLLSDTQVNNIIKLNDSSIKAKILIIDNLDGYLNTSNTNVLSKFKKYINSIFKLGKAVGIFLIITNQKVTNMHLNYINNVSNTILLGNIPEEFNNVLFDANLKSYNSALFNKGMTGNIPSGFGMHYNLTEFNIFKINTVETLS